MNANDFLLVERRDGYMWITFNRADKANALAVSMMECGTAALTEAARDDSVRAVLLTGAGERAFCAGADVREKPADGDISAHRRRRGAALFDFTNAVMDCPKPLVAVLNGIASGGGAMLALLADARVAVESAALSLPEIDLGMPTFTGASIALHVGGLAFATDLVQSGRRMPADEALARGLLTSVVPQAELEATAMHVAENLASKDRGAFAANKRWLNRGVKAAFAEARAMAIEHREIANES